MTTKTPTLDKLAKIRDKSQAIGEFLDWLACEKESTICRHMTKEEREEIVDELSEEFGDKTTDRFVRILAYLSPEAQQDFVPLRGGINSLLAEYFEIDQKQAENERRQLLEDLRRTA